MPLKLNVGLSKKVGLPDYGSVGASCHVEVERDASLIQQDLDTFHRHVKNAYVACSQAVNDELARHNCSDPPTDGGRGASAAAAQEIPPRGERQPRGPNGNGKAAGNGKVVSAAQLIYARQLADQIRGVGVHKLDQLASKLYGKPLEDLSSLQASGLIDTLKAVKSGDVNLDDALRGAAA